MLISKVVNDSGPPMADTEDDGVSAITTLLDTLRPLKPETRANVLDYVFKTLGITAPGPAGSPSPPLPAVPASPAAPAIPPASQHGVSQNLRTITEQKQPKTANEMVAIMAYYLSEHAPQGERRDHIVADDIKKYFVQAGFPQPTGRPNNALTNAKNAGYLDAMSGGQYRLNPVGHNLVVYKLPKGENSSTRPARRGRVAKKGAKGVKKKARG